MLKDDYFKLDFPKSLDKNASIVFTYINNDKTEDVLATLSTFTIKSIERQLLSFKHLPKNCIVTGGGLKNNFIYHGLMKIKKLIYSTKELNINPDTLEAEMICYLTARRINNLPTTFLLQL